MANQSVIDRRAQNLSVGADFIKITGLGPGGVKATPTTDAGSVMTGVQGDTVLEIMAVAAYTLTVDILQTSESIDLLMDLYASSGWFPVSFELGRLKLAGFAVIQNFGEASGAMGEQTRTITIAAAIQTGLPYGIGQTLSA